jgi:saccharopine dehydrogenase-like NADP-dependent oxidoreductase
MATLSKVEILVGGLPVVREFPFEYKAVFSPIDVIEEYTRPARYIENGHEVVRTALSDAELLFFPGIGTLESFNTDGLRSLAKTIRCPNMKEKTLRFPGHIRLMEMLRESGFFDKTPIDVHGVMISPLEFTSRVMFPKWQLKPGEEDFTVMRVIVEGDDAQGRRETVTYDLLDRFDAKNKVTSMARTTGYTGTAGVRLLAEGKFKRPGVNPPEFVGEVPECLEFVLAHLAERDIRYEKTVSRT